MLFETIGQGWVFLWMALFGAAGGSLYLLCAALRRLLRAGTWISLAADLAFSLGLTALFLTGLLTAAAGRFRLYCLLGFLLGFALFISGPAWAAAGLFRRISIKLRQSIQILSKNRLIKVLFR